MKTAFFKEKRLISIFVLTIVLPSVVLSVFGIRAIRNEKFRQDKQTTIEHQRTIALLKAQVSGRLNVIENRLQRLSRHTALEDRDYPVIRKNLGIAGDLDESAELFFVYYGDGKTFFPQLQPFLQKREEIVSGLTAAQESLFRQAREAEFTRQNFTVAITMYRTLYNQVEERHSKARMLSHIARNQQKSGDYSAAVQSYELLINKFPLSVSSSGRPLSLGAAMQIIACLKEQGGAGVIARALDVYIKLADGFWLLNKDQYHLYTEMTSGTIQELLEKYSADSAAFSMNQQYTELQQLHRELSDLWKIRAAYEKEIDQDLRGLLTESMRSKPSPIHVSRTIAGESFLISVVPVFSSSGADVSGLLGVKWNNSALIRHLLDHTIAELALRKEIKIRVTDISGIVLWGDQESAEEIFQVTDEFEAGFPPWRIEIYKDGAGFSEGNPIYRSYYFWSILTLLIILSFGTVIIIRTVARNREVMQMKSDFVSSVSHELKTPLTSIKALTERLLAGNVKSPVKMKEYFTIIAQDTDKLTRLVKNILDSSKIEEGKKEYQFVETDMVLWLDQTIEHFRAERSHDEISISKQFEKNIPAILLDQDEMAQCINNLLDNAVKFSSELKKVEVSLEKKGRFVVISVKDYGVGILDEDLNRIFDKFYQGVKVIRQSVKGAGLGLTLVKHAVEAHGGHIEVESLADRGTTFSVKLPVTKYEG